MSYVSTRFAPILFGVSFAVIEAAGGAPPPDHPHTTRDPQMQSGAMRDAVGVAMKAIRFAASHPAASEADKRAKANDIMSRLFQRELDNGAPGKASTAQPPAARGDGD